MTKNPKKMDEDVTSVISDKKERTVLPVRLNQLAAAQ